MKDMSKKELASKIRELCYLRGDFKLRSGQRSKEYFDKYRFEADPLVLSSVAKHMLPLIPKDTEILAGLEMGALPLASLLSFQSGLPARFVRKEAKDYGTRNLCEGGDIKGKKLCLIEDVISTGGQVIESTKKLRELGAKVSDVICVIFRGDDLRVLKSENLKLHFLFTKKELS